MKTLAIAVPSGAHHRSFLQPLRDLLRAEQDWQFLIVSPGSPWADQLFPASAYPRDRYTFVDVKDVGDALTKHQPALVVTTTAGLDAKDVTVLEAAKQQNIRTLTVIESWDNVWKMDRVQRGLGKGGQRVVLADHIAVWNDTMAAHLLRAFPSITTDRVSVVGAPRLDYFGPRFRDKIPSRETTLRHFDLDPSKRVLHFATTELYDHGHVAKALAGAKQRVDLPGDLQLYTSVHPGGNMDRHRPWADQYGFTMRFSPGRHEPAPHPDFLYNPTQEEMLILVGLFIHTDIAVNLSSTVALESCAADRPVICAFFGKPVNWSALNPVHWFTMSERERTQKKPGSSTRFARSESFDPLARVEWYRSMVARDFKEHYADMLRGGGIAVARNPRQLIAQINEYLAHPEKDGEGRRKSAEIIATSIAGDASSKVVHTIQKLLTA
jgi:hypothetical protein